jgi:hypothetical protein
MILARKKGKNTVQASVIFRIFRNVMGERRSDVNQTNSGIKSARGVRRGVGKQCEVYVGQSQR